MQCTPIEAADTGNAPDNFHVRMPVSVKFHDTAAAAEHVVPDTSEFSDGAKYTRASLQAALVHAGAHLDFTLQFLHFNCAEWSGGIDYDFTQVHRVGVQRHVEIDDEAFSTDLYQQGDVFGVTVFDGEGQCPAQYVFKLNK